MRVKGKTKSQKINAEQLKKFVPLSDKALQNMVNGGEALSPQQQYAMAQNVGKTAQESGGNYSTSFGAGGQNVTVTNKNTGTTTTTDTGNNSNFNFTGVGNGSFRPTANNPSGKPALSGAEQQAFANQQNPNIPSNYNIPGTGNANSDVVNFNTFVKLRDDSDIFSKKTEMDNGLLDDILAEYEQLKQKDEFYAFAVLSEKLVEFEKNTEIVKRIEKAIGKIGRRRYDYITSFMCDNYVQEVLTEAGFNFKAYLAGDANTKTCDEHIKKGDKGGVLSKVTPTECGVYVVLMGTGYTYTKKDGTEGTYASHAALLVVQDGYQPYLIHNSTDNKLFGYEGGCTDIMTNSTTSSVIDRYKDVYANIYFQKVG